ncbi:MAG: hypothetical protein EXS17_02350 [Phycisphaerales bacterium]|nr:hypothetical protein [Phycisphaerales bacterium]
MPALPDQQPTQPTSDLGRPKSAHKPMRRGRESPFLLLAVRLIFIIMLVVVTTVTVASSRNVEDFGHPTVIGLIIAGVSIGLVVLLLDHLTPEKRLTSVAGVYLGICLGLIAAVAIGSLIDTVARAWEISSGPAQLYLGLSKLILGIVLCYLSVSIVLTTKDDFRLVIPYVEFNKQPSGLAAILLDSSTIIDGRIEALATSQILDAPLVVPKFVLDELQHLCDSSDKHKRAKGRRGLDVISRMQENSSIDLRIEPIDLDGRGVDRMLVELASREHMRIATSDSGLQKVANISGIVTINLHAISLALQPQLFPGEIVAVEITRVGEQGGQGVGHLADGTMVVIDGAAELVGSRAEGVINNILQTAGGRIIFARAEAHAPGTSESMAAKAVGQPREPIPENEHARREPSHGGRNPRRG